MTGRDAPRAGWPFPRDPAVAGRIAALRQSIGDRLVDEVLALADARAPGDGLARDRSLIRAAEAEALVASFGLASRLELAVLAIPAAATLARPPISDYHVGAVGLAPTGDLVLGGNLEFPGASIHHTVHGEGFVTLRSRALGLDLEALAIGEARPCAHCRQVLAEMAWADRLRLVDPFGADIGLWDAYPAAFVPGDLGMAPAGPGGGPPLSPPAGVPPDVAAVLSAAGGRAHAPYSGEPAAIALRTELDGIVGGAVLESVAFNPTIGPLQDALVGLAAAGVPYGDVREAWLATARDARVGHVAATRDLLAAVAPDATLEVTYWP